MPPNQDPSEPCTALQVKAACIFIFACIYLPASPFFLLFFFFCLSEVMAQFQELKKTRFINSSLKAPLSRTDRSWLPASAASPGTVTAEGLHLSHIISTNNIQPSRKLAGALWAAAPWCRCQHLSLPWARWRSVSTNHPAWCLMLVLGKDGKGRSSQGGCHCWSVPVSP